VLNSISSKIIAAGVTAGAVTIAVIQNKELIQRVAAEGAEALGLEGVTKTFFNIDATTLAWVRLGSFTTMVLAMAVIKAKENALEKRQIAYSKPKNKPDDSAELKLREGISDIHFSLLADSVLAGFAGDIQFQKTSDQKENEHNKGVAENYIGKKDNGYCFIKLPSIQPSERVEALKRLGISIERNTPRECYEPANWSELTLPEGWSATMKNMSYGDCEIIISDESAKVRSKIRTVSGYGYMVDEMQVDGKWV